MSKKSYLIRSYFSAGTIPSVLEQVDANEAVIEGGLVIFLAEGSKFAAFDLSQVYFVEIPHEETIKEETIEEEKSE